MRRVMLGVVVCVGLASTGCTREAAIIGAFAAAAAAQGTMLAIDHCTQEGVDCSPPVNKRHVREKHDDPYSNGVDW